MGGISSAGIKVDLRDYRVPHHYFEHLLSVVLYYLKTIIFASRYSGV